MRHYCEGIISRHMMVVVGLQVRNVHRERFSQSRGNKIGGLGYLRCMIELLDPADGRQSSGTSNVDEAVSNNSELPLLPNPARRSTQPLFFVSCHLDLTSSS